MDLDSDVEIVQPLPGISNLTRKASRALFPTKDHSVVTVLDSDDDSGVDAPPPLKEASNASTLFNEEGYRWGNPAKASSSALPIPKTTRPVPLTKCLSSGLLSRLDALNCERLDDSDEDQNLIVNFNNEGKKRSRSKDISAGQHSTNESSRPTKKKSPPTTYRRVNLSDSDEQQALQPKASTSETTASGKRARVSTDEKEAKTAEKAAEKQAKKAEQAAASAAKKDSVQDNKNKSRRETLHELVIEISTELADKDAYFQKLLPDLNTLLRGKDGDKPSTYTVFVPPDEISDAKLVRWRRYTNKYLDQNTNTWIRYEDSRERCYIEKTILMFIRVKELVEIVQKGKSALLNYINLIRNEAKCQGSDWQFFFLVEGMKAFGRGETNRANRESKAEARGKSAGGSNKQKASSVSFDEMNMELTRLDMIGSCIVQKCDGPEETTRLLHELSMDISYRPYKLQQRSFLSNLGIDGTTVNNSSKANDYRSTFIAQLASIHMVQAGQAEGIANKYKTWRGLYEAYEACSTLKQKQDMLVGIDVGRNRNGTDTDRKIGAATSKRIYIQLWTRDPNVDMSGNFVKR